jgi:hypothetical protein
LADFRSVPLTKGDSRGSVATGRGSLTNHVNTRRLRDRRHHESDARVRVE